MQVCLHVVSLFCIRNDNSDLENDNSDLESVVGPGDYTCDDDSAVNPVIIDASPSPPPFEDVIHIFE